MSAGRDTRLAREAEAETIAAALRFPDARERYCAGQIHPAELAAIYIAERVHRAVGARWLQADRPDPPAIPGDRPCLRLFAERELCRVPAAVPRALLGWAAGEREVELLFEVPTPRRLLGLQARGRRCVSLLADGAPTAPHEDGLAFVVHDLCHLEKFVDPAHHVEQIGFFALLDRALASPEWAALEAPLDALWASDRDHVLADMNGSAVFLFLVLKNKLKLAIRRRLARERGLPAPSGGPLDPAEEAACAEGYAALLARMSLEGPAFDAGIELSSREDAESFARPLLARFRAEGEAVLRYRRGEREDPASTRAGAV